MDKALRLASVALALAAPLTAQAGAKSDSLPVVRGSYDPAHDLTSLKIEPFPISEQLSLSVLALVGGRLPAAPTVVMFTFLSPAPGLRYRQNHRVRLVVDGRTTTVDQDGWWAPGRGAGDQERVVANLSAKQFTTIASASRVTLNVGPTRVEVSAPAMAALRELALRMGPGAASVAIDTVRPGGMVFDSTRLRSYSNAELVALLSQESLERNISGSQGLVNLGATSPSP